MTRAEKVAEAQRLRAEGLTLREIGERLGAAKQTVHQYLDDPDMSKLRARKDIYRGECIDCGAPTDGSRGYNAPIRCASCNGRHQAHLNNSRLREKYAERRAIIEAMWADGLSIREIRELASVPGFNPGPCRARGYNLPHRRTAEQVARIREGRWGTEMAA